MAAALLLAIASGDGLLLVTGIHRERRAHRDRVEALDRAVGTRSRALRRLQDESNDARAAVSAAFDAVDEILVLGRGPEGIPQAQARWPAAVSRMGSARQASLLLPGVTARLIAQARSGRDDLNERRRLGGDASDLRYLDALDRALSLLIETHVVYSEMNRLISEGFRLYEELFLLTDTFLREQREGTYRNDREAADVYAFRTEHLVAPVARLKGDLGRLQESAERIGERALDAFQEAARLGRARGRR